MKKIILLMLISIATVLQAQTSALDAMLTQLNTTQITSGILYERVLQSSDLYNFNKTVGFNSANFEYFQQALSELYRASNNQKLISKETLLSRVSYSQYDFSIVDMGIINTPFHILNYNEENPLAGGLTFNESTQKFSSITGKPSFFSTMATIVSPLKKMAKGSQVRFHWNNKLFLQNSTPSIKTMTVNYGIGTTYTVISNGVLTNVIHTISYNFGGTKEITCSITYSNGKTLVTKGKFYLHYISPNTLAGQPTGACATGDPNREDDFIVSEEATQGYNAGDPLMKSRIDYRIFYSTDNTQKMLMKPIIIIDGFDPGDHRKIQDCDCANDSNCREENSDNDIFNPNNHDSMEDSMLYKSESNQNSFLLSELRDLGYDVIMVNHPTYYVDTHVNPAVPTTDIYQTVYFPIIGNVQVLKPNVKEIDGGAYYIESNAMAMVSLIKSVKNTLANNGSTEQLVLVGPSMGGQISRFALAYMEKKFAETGDPQWQHKTRLWISIDSPHLGANIPLGDQSLLFAAARYGGSDGAANFYDKQLNSPAAKQQLIEFRSDNGIYENVDENSLNGRVQISGFPSDDGNTFHTTWYNKVNTNGLPNSKGYPQNLRKIALVNGSLSGKTFGTDSEKVLNIRGFQRVCVEPTSWLGIDFSYCFDVHIASLESYYMPTYNSGSKRISRFKSGFVDRYTYATNINNRGNMDTVPGGWYPTQGKISAEILGERPISWGGSFWEFPLDNIIAEISTSLGRSYFELREFKFNNSFIPSFSSIAHKNPNQSWANPLNYNLVCSNETYFDSYFGHDENTQHTSFTKESARWLKHELAGNAQAPYFPIPNTALNGVNAICVNATANYSFENCKVPSGATWSVSTNTLQLLASDPYNIIVKGIADGFGYITATFQNEQVFTKKIWVGKTQFSGQNYWGGIYVPIEAIGTNETPTYTLCKNYNYTPENSITFELNGLNPNAIANTSNVQWEKVSGDFYFYSYGNRVYFQPFSVGQIIIKGRAYNDCGWSNWQMFSIDVKNCGTNNSILSSRSESLFNIYPNPADTQLTIESKDKALAQDYQVSLYNMAGLPVAQQKAQSNTATLSTQSLPNGIYTLQITYGTQKEAVQIEIKH